MRSSLFKHSFSNLTNTTPNKLTFLQPGGEDKTSPHSRTQKNEWSSVCFVCLRRVLRYLSYLFLKCNTYNYTFSFDGAVQNYREIKMRSLKYVIVNEDLQNEFASRLSDFIRFSEEFDVIVHGELIETISEKIWTETNTESWLREKPPDSDDSGCEKGRKRPGRRTCLGDEIKSVFWADVFFRLSIVDHQISINSVVSIISGKKCLRNNIETCVLFHAHYCKYTRLFCIKISWSFLFSWRHLVFQCNNEI